MMFTIALIGKKGTANTGERAWHDWMKAHPNVHVVGGFLEASGPLTAGQPEDSLLFIGHPIGPVITRAQIDDLAKALAAALQCAEDVEYGTVAA